MCLEEKADDKGPHHVMIAGAGAMIGYSSYLVWPMYFISPYIAAPAGGPHRHFTAKPV